jgi:hypothetical protein
MRLGKKLAEFVPLPGSFRLGAAANFWRPPTGRISNPSSLGAKVETSLRKCPPSDCAGYPIEQSAQSP